MKVPCMKNDRGKPVRGDHDRLEYEKKFCSEYVINIPVNCDENLMKM